MITSWSMFALSNSLVVLVGATFLLMSRRWFHHPAAAHLIWLALLIKLATPPLINLPVPVGDGFVESNRSEVNLALSAPETEPLRDQPVATVLAASELPVAENEPAVTRWEAPIEASADEVHAATQPVVWLPMIVAGIWVAGFLSVLVVTLLRQAEFHHLVRQTREAGVDLQEEVQRLARDFGVATPEVRVTKARIVPCVYGSKAKAILLLPQPLIDQLSPEERRTVIAHELAHVHRRDPARAWFEIFLVSLLWWNPLAWLCKRQLRLTADECCDGWVLRWLPQSAIAYAGGMLKTLDYLADGGQIAPRAAYGFGESNSLKRRFQAVLQNRTRCRMPIPLCLSCIGIMIIVLLMSPVAAQQESSDSTRPDEEDSAQATSELPAGERIDQATIAAWIRKTPDLKRDVADAILDWVDEDNEPRAFGAEKEYYESLSTPYTPRNDSLRDMEELLLVRGVDWKTYRSLAARAGKGPKANLQAIATVDKNHEDRGTANVGRQILTRIPGLTDEVADAILDWIDEDDEVREFGAESAYYAAQDSKRQESLPAGWNARNLQRIRGITPQLAERILEFLVAENTQPKVTLPKPLDKIQLQLGQLAEHFEVIESRFYKSGQFRTPDPRPRVVKEDTIVLQLRARNNLSAEKLRPLLRPFPTIHFQKRNDDGRWLNTELRDSGYFLYAYWNGRPVKKSSVIKAWVHLGTPGAAGLIKAGASQMRVASADAIGADGDWGHIKGRFVLQGEIPPQRRLRVLRDAKWLGDFVIDQSLVVDAKTRGISNVLILVTSKPSKVHPDYMARAKKPHEVVYSGGHIQPRINLVQVGQQVKLVNQDPIANHAAIHTIVNSPVSILLPARAHNQLVYKKPEKIPAQVRDNVHVFHQAYLLVKDHPYMTVTDKQGRFELKNLPAGDLEIRCWHERTGWIQAKPDWKQRRLRLNIQKQATTDLGELQLHSSLFQP